MNKLVRSFPLMALPLIIGAVAYFATTFYNSASSEEIPGPRLEMPALVDVGLCEPGTRDVVIELVNRGVEPLKLSDFETSCSCAIIAKASAPNDRLTQVLVSPGETLELLVKVSIKPSVDRKFHTVITFQTNDPKHPHVELPITGLLDGRLTSSPAQLALGAILPETVIEQTLTIQDSGRQTPRRLHHAESSIPQIIQVKQFQTVVASATDLDQIVASMKVQIACPKTPQLIDGEIRLYEEGNDEPVLRIPVTGVRHPPLILSPSTISLPRYTGEGLVYSLVCLVRQPDDQPFELTVESPPEIHVECKAANETRSLYRLSGSWSQDFLPPVGERVTRTIHLTKRTGQMTESIPLSVNCSRNERSP